MRREETSYSHTRSPARKRERERDEYSFCIYACGPASRVMMPYKLLYTFVGIISFVCDETFYSKPKVFLVLQMPDGT